MRWLVRRTVFAALAGLFPAAAGSLLATTPTDSPPTRPGAIATAGVVVPPLTPALSILRFGRVEYVDATEFGARFGLKFTWLEDEKRFLLKSATTTWEIKVDSRESMLDGQRVFLGDPVRLSKGRPYFSRIDAERLLTPILQPGWGETRVPALHTIVLDPGHGGKDTGKVNERLRVQEKDLALDTALRLKQRLEQDGYRVALTRDTDRAVELTERATVARQEKADLFLSIHYNSVENDVERVSGVEVYTMTPQHQLSADQRPDDQVDVFNEGNRYDHWNAVLGDVLHRQLLRELKVSDRGYKRGRLAVLRLAPCPAILIESGYLSQDAEARKIATPAYRQKIADAIADGVQAYAAILDRLQKKPAADLPR
ncbi:MAG TPA: N-acetylmuramoyl-L-alanine amidase [Opitutaceae bacterium]|nr:N-acetylmuramoyl-L-alanine amidase [Opitutaceae bacterium]